MNSKFWMWFVGLVVAVLIGGAKIYLSAQDYTDKKVKEIKEDVTKKIDEVQGDLRITKERVDRILETVIKIDERTKRLDSADRNRPR